MSTTTFFRRSGAVLASTGIAAALALIPGGAHANVKAAYFASGEAEARYTGSTPSGECTLTSGNDSPESSETVFGHGTKHKSLNLNATFTSPDDSGDQVQVKGHLDSKVTIKKTHHDLASYRLQTGGSIQVNHSTSGSSCQGMGELAAGSEEVLFTEHKKGRFTYTRDVKKGNALDEFVLVNEKTEHAVTFEIVQSDTTTHETSTAVIKPGTYVIEAEAGAISANGLVLRSAPRSSKVSLTNTITAQFTPLKKKHHHRSGH